jgi:ribosomal protein S27AE
MTLTVVEELMLHNKTCPQCGAGEPCLVAEHIQDCWPQRVASQAAAVLSEIAASVVEEQPIMAARVRAPQFSRFG